METLGNQSGGTPARGRAVCLGVQPGQENQVFDDRG